MRLSWLLVDELAIGTAPGSKDHLDRLEREGIRAVLSLCDVSEAPPPEGLADRFAAGRFVLPSHHSGRSPEPWELEQALASLHALASYGPVYMHCVAGVERSPLVAMAWLIERRCVDLMAALDYVQQVHPGTSPLPGQLACLKRLRLRGDPSTLGSKLD